MNEQIFRSPLPSVPLASRSIFTHLLWTSPDTPHLVGGFPASSPAFIDAATGVTISRGQLRSFALQLAHSLINLPEPLRGQPSAITRPTILIFSPNSIVWPIILLGAAAAGFTTALANSSYNQDELRREYNDSGAYLVFVHPSLLDTAEKMLTSAGSSDAHARIIVASSGWLTHVSEEETSDTPGLIRLENLLDRGELTSEITFNGEQSNEAACICYSSGTEGKPRGIVITHYNLTSVIDIAKPVWPSTRPCLAPSLAEIVGAEQPDIFLGPLPYYHIFGMVKLVLLPVALCTPSVIVSRFVPEMFLKAIEKYRATCLVLIPPIFLVFARHDAIYQYDLTCVRTIISGAAPLCQEQILVVKKRLEGVGSHVAIVQGYGLTETSPTVFILPTRYAYDHPGSVGLPLPNLEVRLVQNDTQEDPTGFTTAGEVWVRGPTVMKGYLNNPSATAAAITKDGWFKTGDIATRDSEGLFTIVDRREEFIRYGKFQIPPAELEFLLLQHPMVTDAAVVGVPNWEGTESPRAYIIPVQPIPKDNAETFASGIQEWVARRVPPHNKLRGGIVLVECIPRSAAGKIQRRELRHRAESDPAYGQHQENDGSAQPKKPEVAENDYVIFVVGPTEAGKTRFTRQLSKSRYVAQGGHPHTKNVEAWRCNLDDGPVNIVVIDTPSFHAGRDNVDAGDMITDWLESNFTQNCHPGILFLHSLDSDLTCDDTLMSRHIEMFAKAFPSRFKVPSRIYVVPTSNSNSTYPSEKLGQKDLQLNAVMEALNGHGNYKWHASVFPGVFKGEPEMAWSAVLLFLKDMSLTQAEELIHPPVKPALRRMSLLLPNDRLTLKDFSDSLFKEYRKGWNSGLDAMTTLGRTVLELSSPTHPRHHVALTNLADLLSEQFKNEGADGVLDEIITLERAALECMPQNHSRRQTILLELDDRLNERFRRGDAIADLEEIVSLRRAVLELAHPANRGKLLLNLANALHEKFQKTHLVNDINGAVNLAVEALGLCCPGHPDYPLSQDHLVRYLKAEVTTRGTRAQASDTSNSVSLDIKQLVKRVFFAKAEKLPPRLLHTPTGVLCNRDAQLSHFENSLQYKQLLSSTSPRGSQQLETEINETISEFFEFTMLSHRWGDNEPLLRDIKGKRIYGLGGVDGLAKLQNFCILALQRGFQWAWSDTCCIDKDSSAELQEAIGSMFSWYHWSSLTIVYLADVAGTGSLAHSDWFKRGWTLQELLASNTVLFYAKDWSPYLNSGAANHKTDPTLLEELCKATRISEQHLRNFNPGVKDSRSRLCWASHRRTTRPEDVAYSLFGIFEVHLPVMYGETAQNALGRLLEAILSRSGDVSVLDWVGKQSSFNSCFPADLEQYQTVPHTQLIPSDPAIREGLDFDMAQKLYADLARLARVRCVDRKITLPSIIHPVTTVAREASAGSPSRYTYQIHASRLAPLKFISSFEFDGGAGKYILVRPWRPKSLQVLTRSNHDAIWHLLEELEQPFNALLLESLLHNQYKRIACDCTITACVQVPASILDSEVVTLEVV